MRHFLRHVGFLGLFLCMALWAHILFPGTAAAESAAHLNKSADAALKNLYSKEPGAKALGEKARGILVFPPSKKEDSS